MFVFSNYITLIQLLPYNSVHISFLIPTTVSESFVCYSKTLLVFVNTRGVRVALLSLYTSAICMHMCASVGIM